MVYPGGPFLAKNGFQGRPFLAIANVGWCGQAGALNAQVLLEHIFIRDEVISELVARLDIVGLHDVAGCGRDKRPVLLHLAAVVDVEVGCCEATGAVAPFEAADDVNRPAASAELRARSEHEAC